MGFLNNMAGALPEFVNIKNLQNACTLPDFFIYWRDNLFERLMRLFIWDTQDDTPAKEIEERLFLAGHCGIADYDGLTAFFGSFFGVTKYQDEWSSYNVHCPIYSNSYTIGKDIAIIENNSLKNASIEHVNHYAKLLAHTDVTLMRLLVEARDTGGVPIAKNEKAKQSIIDYQKKIYVGKISTITDLAGIGVEYIGADRHTQLKIDEVWDVRTKLLKQFYSDIGVRSTFDKRSNAVVYEVTSDTSMLLYNVSDMLECRKRGADDVNKLFVREWSVRLSDEINYTAENEPETITAAEEVRADDVSEDGR